MPPAPLGLEAPLGNARYPLFDGLRGIAVTVVLIAHLNAARPLPGLLGRFASHGNAAQALFFVLSGFLLYRPFVTARLGRAPTVGVRTFYLRRILRIVPAYWVALTLLAIYPGLVGFHDYWWRMYAFSQIYEAKTYSIGIPPAWSLCVEITFYALLPVYAYLMARLSHNAAHRGKSAIHWLKIDLVTLAGLALASMGVHLVFSGTRGYPTLAGTFYLIALGMGLASCSVAWRGSTVPKLIRDHANACWSVALVLFVVISFAAPASRLGSANPLYGPVALAFALPAAVDAQGIPGRVLRARAVVWFGLIAYGLFLWQANLIALLDRHIRSTPLLFLVASLASVVAGAVSYYIVEAPFLRRKARLARARRVSQHSTHVAA